MPGRGTKPFVGSIGLIRQFTGDGVRWLAVHDCDLRLDRFPQADRGPDETYRDALIREIGTLLPIDPKRDIIVSRAPRLHFQAPIEVGGRGCRDGAADRLPDPRRSRNPEVAQSDCNNDAGGEIVWHLIEFFVVELYGQTVPRIAADLPDCRWWTPTEIIAGRHADGTEFDSLQQRILRRLDVITVHSRA